MVSCLKYVLTYVALETGDYIVMNYDKAPRVTSLDFLSNRFFVKLFKTINTRITVVTACETYFSFEIAKYFVGESVRKYQRVIAIS